MTSAQKYTVAMAVVLLSVIALHVVIDAVQFHRIARSQSKNNWCCSWYDQSWLKMPYTNLRLAFEPSHEYWATNGVGDPVLLKDVQYKGATFWTELRREKAPG